jgi:hypothetical protein
VTSVQQALCLTDRREYADLQADPCANLAQLMGPLGQRCRTTGVSRSNSMTSDGTRPTYNMASAGAREQRLDGGIEVSEHHHEIAGACIGERARDGVELGGRERDVRHAVFT